MPHSQSSSEVTGTSARYAAWPLVTGGTSSKRLGRTTEWMPSAPMTAVGAERRAALEREVDAIAVLGEADEPVAGVDDRLRHDGPQDVDEVGAVDAEDAHPASAPRGRSIEMKEPSSRSWK